MRKVCALLNYRRKESLKPVLSGGYCLYVAVVKILYNFYIHNDDIESNYFAQTNDERIDLRLSTNNTGDAHN